MSEWRSTTIGAEVTLQRGIDITRATQRDGTIPVVSSGGVSSYHDEAAVRGPGVVLGRKGVVGSVWYVEGDYWPHDTTLWVRDFHGNDPRFVYYFFKWFAPRLASLDVGSANPTLNRNHVHPTPVRWPALAEQRRIAGILGALDDKIELNRRTSETLEAMARALFRAWLNPKGTSWALAPLSAIFDINPPRPLPRDRPAPHLDMANMPTRGPSATEIGSRAPGSGAKFENGDTLLARITPCLENGKVAFVDFLAEGERGWGSTEYIVLRPRDPIPDVYAYCLAREPEFVAYAVARMNGSSGRQRVSASAIGEYRVRVPPAEVAERFGRAVRPLFGQITAHAAQNTTLVALRDTLLPRLLAGSHDTHALSAR